MKVALLANLDSQNLKPVQNGLSVNYFGNNKNVFSFPMYSITKVGGGAILYSVNTTNVPVTHYIVNSNDLHHLKLTGFLNTSSSLTIPSYGFIVDKLATSSSSISLLGIDTSKKQLENLVVYVTLPEIPKYGNVFVYAFFPQTDITSANYIVPKVIPPTYYLTFVNPDNVLTSYSLPITSTSAIISGDNYLDYMDKHNMFKPDYFIYLFSPNIIGDYYYITIALLNINVNNPYEIYYILKVNLYTNKIVSYMEVS